jgi:hypothetical protein
LVRVALSEDRVRELTAEGAALDQDAAADDAMMVPQPLVSERVAPLPGVE